MKGVKIADKYNCSKGIIYRIISRQTYCSAKIDGLILEKVKKIKFLKKKTPTNELNIQDIVDDYLNGISYLQLSKKYNSSVFTIRKILISQIDQSIIDKNKMQPISQEFGNKVVKDYLKNNLTAEDIGNMYGVSKYVIYDILSGRTFDIDPKFLDKIKEIKKENSSFLKLTPDIVRAIFSDYATGEYSQTDLSKKYNTSASNISFLLKRETQNNIEIDEFILNKVNILLDRLAISAKRISKDAHPSMKTNIFTDWKNCLSKKEISEKYNLTLDRVVRVLNHTAWKNVPLLDETLRQYSTGKITRITPDEAYNIIIDYCNGLSVNDLKLKYNTRNSIIYKIIRRETFKDLNIGEYENLCKEQLMKRNNQTKYINTPRRKSIP
jgi:Mor family transcriptional regulator